jgi:hypothetical protein
MSIAHALNHGRTLYLDAWDHHTFLDIFFFQAVLYLFGPWHASMVIHLVNIFLVVTMAAIVHSALRLLGHNIESRFAGVIVCSYLFSLLDFRSSQGEFYHSALSAFAFLIYFLLPRTRVRLMLVGALLMAGFCIKQTALFDMAALGFIEAVRRLWIDRRGTTPTGLGWMSAGAGAIVSLAALYFLWHGTVRLALYMTFIDPVIYATGGTVAETLQKYGGAVTRLFSYLFEMHIGILLLLASAYAGTLYAWSRASRPDWLPGVIGTAFWLLIIFAGIVSIGRFYGHYFMQAVVPLSLLTATGLQWLLPWMRRIALLAMVLFLYLLPAATHDGHKHLRGHDPEPLRLMAEYIRENTSPNDPIYLYQNTALCLYFLTERFPPTKVFMDHQLLPENRDAPQLKEEAIAQLHSRPPVFVIKGTLNRSVPEIDSFIETHYSVVTNTGAFTVYRFQSAGGVSD